MEGNLKSTDDERYKMNATGAMMQLGQIAKDLEQ
jgi:hypothetical protein